MSQMSDKAAESLEAAAPDLLFACEEVLADHDERSGRCPDMNSQPNRLRVMELLRAAIKGAHAL